MRILKVWDGEYPWDVRAEKVCKALTEAGHEMHMVARNRRRDPTLERLDECTVHRMRPWPWMGETLDAASQFPAFFSPRWLRLMHRTGSAHKVHVVLVRDLPLAPAAVWVGRRLGVPVVLDMAENYPAMIQDLWTTGSTKPGDFFVRNPRAVSAVERWVLKRVDHVLVVVEESQDRLVQLGVSKNRISIVGNTPSKGRVEEFGRIKSAASPGNSDSKDWGAASTFRLVYLGLMEEARGVGLVIEAVAEARSAGAPVTLELIGDGRSLPRFRQQARELHLEGDAVRFHGYLPYQQALTLVAGCDAGLIPHFANESWETTIPNKLFDYMSLRLPVIASDVAPVARVLHETGAGVTFRDRQLGDLTEVIRSLHADPERLKMGDAGVRAVKDRYHWERDALRLNNAIERAVHGRQGVPGA